MCSSRGGDGSRDGSGGDSGSGGGGGGGSSRRDKNTLIWLAGKCCKENRILSTADEGYCVP